MAMRVVRASNTSIRQAYLDQELTLPQAAASLGMCVDALRARAAGLGLPPKRGGRRMAIRPHQEAELRTMWALDLSIYDIAEHFGCSYTAVRNAALRVGLPARSYGYKPSMALHDYRQYRLSVLMARAARKAGHR